MAKYSRGGGKYTGNHSSVTKPAGQICDIVERCPHVTKLSPGFIKQRKRNGSGAVRVKLLFCEAQKHLSIRVHGEGAIQFIRAYTDDVAAAQSWIVTQLKRQRIDFTCEQQET